MPNFEFTLHNLSLRLDHKSKRVVITAIGVAQDENGDMVTATLESPELQASFDKHLADIMGDESEEYHGDITADCRLAAQRVHQDLQLPFDNDRMVQ
jgi:hypothetical protein